MSNIVRVCVLAVSYSPSPAAATPPASGPSNVPRDHWGYAAVEQLERQGLFTGYASGAFSGERLLTRYEFAVALQRMLTEVFRTLAVSREDDQTKLWRAVERKLRGLRKPVHVPERLESWSRSFARKS